MKLVATLAALIVALITALAVAIWVGVTVDLTFLRGQVEAAASAGGLVLNGRKLRVAFAPPRDGEAWPPPGFAESERPPVG